MRSHATAQKIVAPGQNVAPAAKGKLPLADIDGGQVKAALAPLPPLPPPEIKAARLSPGLGVPPVSCKFHVTV
jgi:hypothetical protein